MGYPIRGMRCPSCGTENAPDSRFCGGCGAKLTPAESRVAPTAKISDDARYPQYSSNPPPVDMPRTASRPPEMPPQQVQRTVSKPPSMPPPVALGRAATEPVPPPPRPQQPMAQASSVALPRSGRRWGLVIALLVVDAGLGVTGAVLLASGGGHPTVAAPTPAVAPAPGPATAPAPAPAPAPAKKAEVEPKIEVGKTIVTKHARTAPPPAKVAQKPATKPKAKPEDPYAAGSATAAPIEDDEDHSGAISDAIDQKSNHAQATFSRCYTQATKGLPPDAALRGRIQIAFTVLPNGRVDGVRTAENQTGSAQLASCLSSEIGGWSFADHPQDPIEITKIFAFGPSS